MLIASGKLPEPITMAKPHEGMIPHCYVAVENTQYCTCCGATHSWTQVFAKTFMRSSNGLGKPVRNLRSLDWPKYNLPIEQVRGIHEELPFCSSCYKPSLAHSGMLEPPAVDMSKVVVGFATTPIPKVNEVSGGKTKGPKPNLDSLVDLLL